MKKIIALFLVVSSVTSLFGAEAAFIGTFAGKEAQGIQNVGIGYSALYSASATNTVAIGQAAASGIEGSVRNVFIGQDAGRNSTNLFGCVGIGTGVFCGSNAETNAISIGNRIVVADDLFFITPDEMRPFIFAPIWWSGGNLVFQGDDHVVVACPSNVVIKAGVEVSITNAVLYGSKMKVGDSAYSLEEWTPRLVVEDGSLAVYVDGEKIGTVAISK